MYDGGRILTGLVIFLALITLPLWYNQALGEAGHKPEVKIETEASECVAPTQYMRTSHMVLLNEWREMVVRGRDRVHVAPDGKEYEISLSNTCMECHPNRKEFCQQCHDYVGVDPYCWDCHIEHGESE
jgi:hypothetical protein